MEQSRNATASIKISNLSKDFGKVEVLRNISLSITDGTSVAVTGPSGSGKSTLLHIIGTLEEPSAGQVEINKTNPFTLSEPELAQYRNSIIGFVFQDHHLLPQYSVLENVLIPTLAFKQDPGATQRAHQLLRRVGLTDRQTHRPAELSGGERQRVAIARALINQPDILLCDEPSGNLDTATTETIANLLFELHNAEKNILIVVTHNLALASRFDRHLLLTGRRVHDQKRFPNTLRNIMRKFSWNALKHFWQIHLTVALCTAIATGVLAGALIVGDSVRGSLRSLTTERLGAIQHALLADHFFQPDLLQRENKVPAILLNGTIVVPQTQKRASKVNIAGVTDDFFMFWKADTSPNLNKTANQPFNAIVINEALQNELNVQIGDTLLVNMPQTADIHPEFLLGERDASKAIQSLRLVISDIIPTKSAGAVQSTGTSKPPI